MGTIERTEYLNRIKNLKDTPDIKVISGIRKSGESILMQEYETIKHETHSTRHKTYLYIITYKSRCKSNDDQEDNRS